MALSKVTFTRTDGNLGTALAGQDHISGLLFDTTSAPGTTSLGDVYQIFSVKDAEGLGILPYKTGETVYMDGLPHLHISEYFRLNPNGTLYVMFDDCSSDWNAIATLQSFAQGSIRQIGIWTPLKVFVKVATDQDPYTLNLVQDINAAAELLANENKPISVLLSANAAGINSDNVTTTMANFPRAIQSYPRVTILLGQGNSTLVQDIQTKMANHATVGWIGAAMAIVAIANVHESPAWLGKFNMIGGNMNSIAMGFGDITVTSNKLNSITPYESISKQQLDQLDDKGFVFPVKYVGKDGTFFSKDRTCSDGDYRMISRNRTIDKSRREIRAVLLDRLNSPLNINPANGQLSAADIKVFKTLVSGPLDLMLAAGNISGYFVNIDANQNVLTDDTLRISYVLIPKGVASNIEVTEGFALSTASFLA